MAAKTVSFRVGRARVYRRGRVWYLAYYEQGKRRQPRVGPDRMSPGEWRPRSTANLRSGPPVPCASSRSRRRATQRWLSHHEYVRRLRCRQSAATALPPNTCWPFCVASGPARPRLTSVRNMPRICRDTSRQTGSPRMGTQRPANGSSRTRASSSFSRLAGPIQLCVRDNGTSPLRRQTVSRDRGGADAGRRSSAGRRSLKPSRKKQFLEACDDWQFPVFLTFSHGAASRGTRPSADRRRFGPGNGVARIRNKPRLGVARSRLERRTFRVIPVCHGRIVSQRGG